MIKDNYREEHIVGLARARNNFWYVHRNKVLERIIRNCGGKHLSIIELGAGSGNISAYLSRKGYKTVASDFYESGVDIMKSDGLKAFQYDIVHGAPSAEAHYKKYDIVILGDVIEHLDDPVQALKNAGQFLKPDGKIIVTVPALTILWTKYDVFAKHKRRYSVKGLSEVMLAGGYEPFNVKYFMFLPGIILLVTRKFKDWLTKNEEEGFPAELEISPILNAIMKTLMSIEYLLQSLIYVPFGSSVYGVASIKK